MLVSTFPPSFRDTFTLSISSQGCKVLCIFISFLVVRSICWSSSLVHLRNGPVYLPGRTAQVFIPLMRFLLNNCGSNSFLVLLRYSFFFSSLFVWSCPFTMFISFLFPEHFDFFLVCYFYSFYRVLLPITYYEQGAFFYAKSSSLNSDCISSLLYKFSNSYSFWQTVWCGSCILGNWYFLAI